MSDAEKHYQAFMDVLELLRDYPAQPGLFDEIHQMEKEKKPIIFTEHSRCPICGKWRGSHTDHRKCSREMQRRHQKENKK